MADALNWAGISISIHAPREGGDGLGDAQNNRGGISIHAPREGGDGPSVIAGHAHKIFQSTPPARGATGSTHSPRTYQS